MEESYSEGLASHAGPESCIDVRKGVGEALTGVRIGRVLSREIDPPPRGGLLRDADAVNPSGRRNRRYREGEISQGPAWSKTPSMYGRTSRGNREIPLSSAIARYADRIGKS
jgi:RNA-directed DNA polymerase